MKIQATENEWPGIDDEAGYIEPRPLVANYERNRYHARVKSVSKQGDDYAVITFAIEGDQKEKFHYRHGQYVTLTVNIAGKIYRRPYSMCSSPLVDDDITIGVKRIEHGKVSNYLNDSVKISDVLMLGPPEGNFVLDPCVTRARHYIFFAAGSGITPILSMIKGVLHAEPLSTLELLYSSKDRHSILFSEKLETLCRRYPDRFGVAFYCTRTAPTFGARMWSSITKPAGVQGYSTRISRDEIVARATRVGCRMGDVVREFYVCGPQGMIDEIVATLKGASVSASAIRCEYFCRQSQNVPTGPAEQFSSGQLPPELRDRIVTIVCNGIRAQVEVSADETILDAAERAGLNPPYSCRSAICSSCTARVISGHAVMSMNNVLTEDDIAQGKIVTCQAHPVTDNVVIEY